jgi:hypothetical protein
MEPSCKIVVPIRLTAWLPGELGRHLESLLLEALTAQAPLAGLKVSRLPKGLLVESTEAPGRFLEAVHAAVLRMEADIAKSHPAFYAQMGSAWTGSLQVVFLAPDEVAPPHAPTPSGA